MTRLSDIPQLRSSVSRTAIALTAPFSLMVMRSFSPFLFISLGLGLFNPIVGLAIPPKNQPTAPATTNRSIPVIYVSSTMGNDGGQGTQQSPFKTITKAVSMAPSNTAIVLAPGTYSSQTGEQFPIILHNSVTLQGNPSTKGKDIIISGGGWYTSKTSAQQNITILGANSSRISGVTITNPNQRGYGLWIESSSLIVSQNTFTGNSHDGISIVGISAPIIQENSFIQNGANGITIYGNSRPEIRNNEFQNTGFGINIAQNAAPFLIGNRVFDNKDGIVIQANARPILRNNQIERNQRDGIVAIAEALPDLGNTQEPGGNVIRNNGRYDLNNGTKGQQILAYGNQLGSNKIIGAIQLSQTSLGGSSPLARQLSNPGDASGVTPMNQTSSLPVYVPESNTASSIPIPVPPPESSRLPPLPPSRPGQPSSGDQVVGLLVPIVSDLILGRPAAVPTPARTQPRRAPQAITQPPQTVAPNSVAAIGVLSVPGPNIPIGSGGGLLPNEVATGNQGGAALSPAALGLRYRVVVEGSSDNDLRRIRSVVPEAFRTVVQGRSVVQAGAFRDQYRANSLLQQLTRSGLRAKIEMMN